MTAQAPTIGRREQRKAELRQTVKDTAWRLVRDRGYAAVTVEQIAAASGISVATFYRHFTGKDDAVTRGWLTPDVMADIAGAVRGDETLGGAVRSLFVRYADLVGTYEVDLLTRLQVIEREPSLRACLMAGRERDIEVLAALFARLYGQDRPAHELQLAAGLIVSARSETLWHWVRTGGTASLGRLLDGAAKIIAPALAACETATAGLGVPPAEGWGR